MLYKGSVNMTIRFVIDAEADSVDAANRLIYESLKKVCFNAPSETRINVTLEVYEDDRRAERNRSRTSRGQLSEVLADAALETPLARGVDVTASLSDL